ncbi:MAG: hypothetical protein U0R19_35370 [Bryobacteraceae bacterium]
MAALPNSQEASLITRLGARLAALARERTIDWSDSWSNEDLLEFRAASVRRLEDSKSEEAG